MLKTIITLPDGTSISSGAGQTNAIQSCTITECVNSEEELTLGSTCCSCLEAKIITPSAGLSVGAGMEVKVSKVDDAGAETPSGVFTLEKPTLSSANIYKITAYDNVCKLDKDLSVWLKGLSAWPYRLVDFAKMVCSACGLTLVTTEIPNGDFPVTQFYKTGVTGRQLMKWIGEIACRFCRANAKGEIELAWYTDSGVVIHPTGERHYFAGALSYEDYIVAPIDAVKLRLADSESGALWPEGAADNPYIITGNAILLAGVTEKTVSYLRIIQTELAALPAYTPCKVSLPADVDIRSGQTVQIIDKNGKTITACVMTKTQAGQRDTLECTGSARRDSPTAANNKTPEQIAQHAVATQTQEEIFNKLTDGGRIQGIYAKDWVWYINAGVAQIENLSAIKITAGVLRSSDGKTCFDLDNSKIVTNNITATGGTIGGCSIVDGVLKIKNVNIAEKLTASQIDATNLKVSAANITGTITAGKIVVSNSSGNTLLSAGDNKVRIGGWNVDENSLYCGSSFSSATCFLCTGSNASMSIGGSDSISGWVFKAGSNFGVTDSGALYANDVHLTGVINATYGKIGGWIIKDDKLYGEYGSLTVAISPVGVSGYYTKADGTKMPVTTTWDAILTAAERWNE